MDQQMVAQVTEAAQWVGMAASAGVIGNRVDSALQRLVGWFRQRGVEPDDTWAEPQAASSVVSAVGVIDSEALAELVELLAGARAEEPQIRIINAGNLAFGDVRNQIHIDVVHGDLRF